MHIKSGFLLLFFAFSIGAQAEQQFFSGLGNYHRKVTTSSKDAQKYFDQGLAFLFAFNHDEAIRSFTKATQLDPTCTMCWWGLANANGPHINNPAVDELHAKAAFDAVQNGLKKATHTNTLEDALLAATSKRFSATPNSDRATLDKSYAQAMRLIWKSHPHDADIGAFFAEAMMNLRPWDLYKQDGAPQTGTDEILETLRSVHKLDPHHPQGLHLLIHSVEAGPHPEEAIGAADRLRDLQPALGHMVHMPSHIDVRTGDWKKAVVANEKAMRSDDAYRAIRPRQGFYGIYMAHNPHMLSFAAMMTGQSKKAIKAIDEMVAKMPTDWAKDWAPVADGYMVMPLEVRIRFGKWEEVLKAADFPEYLPISRALRRAARGVAFSALGEIENAKAEQEAFMLAKQKVPQEGVFGNNKAHSILAVAEHLMRGEILLREHKIDAAVTELKEAVRAEDALRYDEPPDWLQPTRHTLGALLLSVGRFDEAGAIYEADLKKHPHNVWSLWGLSEVYAKQHKLSQAKKMRTQLEQVRQENETDIHIETSCLCIEP